ncbi:MAG: 6,7-dimethyl-8-ribityllumazine synthase [Porphyromonadaceae bacterium]|nr:6,7-dimethyl-8-ribityllumazine synthase [Porphyromonadaceae bacterium]
MSTIDHIQSLHHSPVPSGEGLHIGIAVAEWNDNITEPLLEGALEVLRRQRVKKITVFRVPGAFELVNASARLLEDPCLDAVIAIGCVVRGDTPHFDYICQGVTFGLSQLNVVATPGLGERHRPVIFGVLTTETMAQAEDRAGGSLGNKGAEAAETALKMCRPICTVEK